MHIHAHAHVHVHVHVPTDWLTPRLPGPLSGGEADLGGAVSDPPCVPAAARCVWHYVKGGKGIIVCPG